MSLVSGASPPARIEVAREPSGSANTKPPALVDDRRAARLCVIVRGSGRLRGPRSCGGLLGGLNGGPLDEREKDGDSKHAAGLTEGIDTNTSHRSTTTRFVGTLFQQPA